MKITIEHKDTKVIVEETEQIDRTATMAYDNQNKQIQETIVVIMEQVRKLNESVKE